MGKPMDQSKYRTMQEEVKKYWCKDGKAYVELDNSCQLSEPIYLKRMEELFGVTAEKVIPRRKFEPSATETPERIANPFVELKGTEVYVIIIVFNGEKPIFASCPYCKTRFNIKRSEHI